MVGDHVRVPGLVLVITVGDIAEETGSAVLSMVCPRSSVSTGGRLRILIAADGKKASVSLFMTLFGVGEGPNLSGEKPLSTIWL